LRKSRSQEQTADRGAEEPYEQAGAMRAGSVLDVEMD
jgi:hypothetical protein